MNEGSTSPTANFLNLLLVNKQTHIEACTVFYSLNTFSIGNGDYGSSRDTNVHGLKSFIRRVPARYIHCISHLKIFFYLRKMYTIPAPNLGPQTYVVNYGICSTSDASDVQAIARAVVKHFKGVEKLSLDPCIRGPKRPHYHEPRLCGKRSIDEIAIAVKLLLKHQKVKELTVTKDNSRSQLQEAVERVVEETKSKIPVLFVTKV
jgi:hypothetical protein